MTSSLLAADELLDLPPVRDPALALAADTLLPSEEQTCRAHFRQLASEDFDTRENALNSLTAKGLAVIPLAGEFEKDADAEIASQAKGLRKRILLKYDGYLPTDPGVLAALRKKVDSSKLKPGLAATADGDDDSMRQLETLAASYGVKLLMDGDPGEIRMDVFGGRQWGVQRNAESVLQFLARLHGLAGMPRDGCFLIAAPETIARLRVQRHMFDWSELALDRKEAERVEQAFRPFFQSATEVHTGSEVFSIRSDEEGIRRAARLIALLKSGAPDAIWPAPVKASELAALNARLEARVTLAMNLEEPLNALREFKKQNAEVVFVEHAGDSDGRQEPPFSTDANLLAPLRLTLRDAPLGLALRWIERRVKLIGGNVSSLLAYELGPNLRLQFRLRPKDEFAESALCGADVGFLYPKGVQSNAETDAAARARLLEAIEPHLAVYPAFAPRDVAVLRGRLFMQGPPATLTRALMLVRDWRLRGEPPAPPAWAAALEQTLAAPVEWNGRDSDGRILTVGTLIPALRKLCRVNILIEDAPDGTAAAFEMKGHEAMLLPPGKHAPRALIDAMAARANATWRVSMGAVVLTPPPRKEKKQTRED